LIRARIGRQLVIAEFLVFLAIGKMLFQRDRAGRDRELAGLDAKCVVGIADGKTEAIDQPADIGKMRLRRRRRIGGDAMHQHERAILARGRPYRQHRVDRRLDLVLERKAGGNDHRLSGFGDALHQGRPGHLARGNLEDRGEVVEEVDVGQAERCREERDAGIGRGLGKTAEGFMRQRAPAYRFDAFGLHLGDEVLGNIGLEFHRIGAGFGGRPDQVVCDVLIAFVIDADLGDNPGPLELAEIHCAASSMCTPDASLSAQ
jgi:hypothetical protein